MEVQQTKQIRTPGIPVRDEAAAPDRDGVRRGGSVHTSNDKRLDEVRPAPLHPYSRNRRGRDPNHREMHSQRGRVCGCCIGTDFAIDVLWRKVGGTVQVCVS